LSLKYYRQHARVRTLAHKHTQREKLFFTIINTFLGTQFFVQAKEYENCKRRNEPDLVLGSDFQSGLYRRPGIQVCRK